MLALEVNFLTGRYVASAYNDRSRSEWPPHPARLFSALLATHHAAPEPDAIERDALEWLEEQAAPHIAASEVSERETVTVFVPVNDTTLWPGSGEDHWHAARAELALLQAQLESGNVEAPTEKKLRAAKKKVEQEIERQGSRMRKELLPSKAATDAALKKAIQLLPDRRIRQARTFPSVTPHDPRVVFAWPDAEPNEAHRYALDRLAARLVRLGHSSSLVAARVVDTIPVCNWRPDDAAAGRLRIVGRGQCRSLSEAFGLHRETEPRVLPARFQPYTDQPAVESIQEPRSLFDDDWLVLRRVDGPNLASTSTAGLAYALRRVLLKQAGDPVAEIISGHAASGAPSERDHLAIVPLPFVGHRHADGHIMGLALVLPRNTDAGDRRAVYAALGNWEDDARESDEDAPCLPLHLGRSGTLVLQRLEGDFGRAATLRPDTWCQPSRRWISVTPAALDRHPGDLRSRDVAKLSRSVQEAQEALKAAWQRIGLPAPESVTILPSAPWAGAAKARHFPRFPSDKNRTRRVLTHAMLCFDRAVRGPILLGAGRYLGLGLFHPAEEKDDA